MLTITLIPFDKTDLNWNYSGKCDETLKLIKINWTNNRDNWLVVVGSIFV